MNRKLITFISTLLLFLGATIATFFDEDLLRLTFYMGIIVISGVMMISLLYDKNPLKVMKLDNFKKNYKSYLIGICISFVSLIVMISIIALTGNITVFEFNPENIWSIFYLILIFMVQSLYEEVLMRSVVFDFVRKHFGFLTAIISTALIFSLLHINNQYFSVLSFINIMIYGLFAGVVVYKLKNIYFISGFHFGWNYLQAVLLGVISGIEIENPFITINLKSNMLTGGLFGLETSYLATFVLFILLVIFLNYRVKREKDFSWIVKLPLAHRGYYNDVNPENTLGAFKEAVNNGFAIELDIQLSKDDEVVVFHDYTLNRMCQIDAKVKNFDASELGSFKVGKTQWGIPTLKEVLELVNGKVPLIVEIKNNGKPGKLEKLTYEILSKYHGEFVVQSFNPFSMLWFVNHAPDFIRGQLSGPHGDKKSAPPVTRFCLRNILFNFLAQVDFINIDIHYDNFRIRCLRNVMYKIGYTARSKEEYIKAMKAFDNVIFDNFIYDDELKANSFTKRNTKGKIR